MIQKRGRRYRVQVKHRGIVVADRSFERRTDALVWEREQKQLILMGDFVPPSAGRVTVAQLAKTYLEARRDQVSVRAWESDESALRVHIVPALGCRPIGSVNRVHIERFLGTVASTRSVGTAARVRTTLRGLFDYAVRSRVIRDSPAAAVRLPRPDSGGRRGEFRPFMMDELLAVVEEQRQHAGAQADVTLFLGLTGLRFGELRGLRARDVTNVPYPAVVVARSLPQSGRTGKVIERTSTKSGRSRIVPLLSLALPLVEARLEGLGPDELLFPASQGGYLHAQNWRRAVRWNETTDGRRPHDLRHTAASLWIAAGVDIKTIAVWLGHSSTKLTLDTYGHLMGTDAERAAIERINRAFGHQSGTSPGQTSGRPLPLQAGEGI